MTRDGVASALGGDGKAMRELLEVISPGVRAGVRRALFRSKARSRGRSAEQEAEDFMQAALEYLLANDGDLLRRWDPSRGLSLESFVNLLARRFAGTVLRSGCQNPWRDEPTAPEVFEAVIATRAAGEPTAALYDLADFAARTYRAVEAELSPVGATLLRELFLEEREPCEIGGRHGLSRDAVYAWRSRLAKRLRAAAQELSGEGATCP